MRFYVIDFRWNTFNYTILAHERISPLPSQIWVHADNDFFLVGSWRTVKCFSQIQHLGGVWSHFLPICLSDFAQLKHNLFLNRKSFLSSKGNSLNFLHWFRECAFVLWYGQYISPFTSSFSLIFTLLIDDCSFSSGFLSIASWFPSLSCHMT